MVDDIFTNVCSPLCHPYAAQVNSLLDAHGKMTILTDDHVSGQRHFVVTDRPVDDDDAYEAYSIPSGLPASSADVMRALADQKNILSLSPNETIRMMSNGRTFAVYYEDGRREDALVFYEPGEDHSGSMYWSTSGKRELDAECCLPLHEVTDIILGKQAAAFKTAAAVDIPDHQCITLKSSVTGMSLNLHAPTEEQITAWLFGINSVLTGDGRKIKLNETSVERSSRYSRSFSVLSGAEEMDDDPDFHPDQPYLPYAEKAANAVMAMTNGSTFIKHNEGSKVTEEVFLFYNHNHGKFGTFYWCSPSVREERQDQKLPLHTLTDLFVDHEIFSKADLSDADRFKCFSLVARRVALHLQGSSKAQINQWLSGIRHVLTECGQNVSVQAREPGLVAPDSPRSRSSVFTDAENSVSNMSYSNTGYSTAQLDFGHVINDNKTVEDVIENMVNGARFELYKDDGTKKNIFMFLEQEDGSRHGSLYYCDVNQRVYLEEQRIKINHLTDIYIGKKKETFLLPMAANTDPNCCMSLVSLEGEVHVAAQTEEQLTEWLAGLNYILTSSPERQTKVVAQKKSLSPRKSAIQVENNITKPVTSDRKFSVVPAMLRGVLDSGLSFEEKAAKSLSIITEGTVVNRYSNPANPSKTTVKMFYEPGTDAKGRKLGAVYCCPVDKRDTTGDGIPLKQLTDIFVGKQKDVFNSEIAANVKEAHCFGLVGMVQSFFVEVGSVDLVNTWVSGLRYVLSTGGQQVIMNEEKETKAGVGEQNGPVTGSTDDSGNDTVGGKSTQEIMESMKAGTRFTVFGTVDNPKREDVIMHYDPDDGSKYGALYWCSLSAPRDRSPERELLLENVSAIYIGKRHPLFSTEVGKDAVENRCISINARGNKEFHGEAPTSSTLKDWLTGLNFVLTHRAKREIRLVHAQEVTTEVSRENGGFERQEYSVTHVGSAEESIEWMEKGQHFTMYEADGESSIYMFYKMASLRASRGDCGTLCWVVPGKGEFSIPVSSITKVMQGSYPGCLVPASRDGQEIPEKRIMQLVGERELHLAANSRSHIAIWVKGLQEVLDRGGMDIVIEEELSPSLTLPIPNSLDGPLWWSHPTCPWRRRGPFLHRPLLQMMPTEKGTRLALPESPMVPTLFGVVRPVM